MKRFALVLPLFLAVALSPAFGQGDKKINSVTSELFPLKVGNRWIYQAMDPKEKVVVTVERMEPIKRLTNAGGGERNEAFESFILRTTSGDRSLLEQFVVTEDGIYRAVSAGKEIKPPMRILKLPVAKGDTWTIDSKSENVALKGEFTVEQTVVNLPGKGDVPAWLSKTRDFTVGDQKMEASYWFVPNAGIVKQHVKVGKFEFRIVLEDFQPAGAAIGTRPGVSAPPDLPSLPKLQLEIK